MTFLQAMLQLAEASLSQLVEQEELGHFSQELWELVELPELAVRLKQNDNDQHHHEL